MMLWTFLAACLVLQSRPGDTGDGLPCEASVDCPDLFACREARCVFGECTEDRDCKADATCLDGTCIPECRDKDCPGGFTCDDATGLCRTDCDDWRDCRLNYECCDSQSHSFGWCSTVRACYRY